MNQGTHLTREKLKSLAAGGLDRNQKQAALIHIGECQECAQRFAECFSESDWLTPAADFGLEVKRRLARQQRRRRELFRYSARVGAAACAAIVLLFSQMWIGWDMDRGFADWDGGQRMEQKLEKTSSAMESLRAFSDWLINWGGKEK